MTRPDDLDDLFNGFADDVPAEEARAAGRRLAAALPEPVIEAPETPGWGSRTWWLAAIVLLLVGWRAGVWQTRRALEAERDVAVSTSAQVVTTSPRVERSLERSSGSDGVAVDAPQEDATRGVAAATPDVVSAPDIGPAPTVQPVHVPAPPDAVVEAVRPREHARVKAAAETPKSLERPGLVVSPDVSGAIVSNTAHLRSGVLTYVHTGDLDPGVRHVVMSPFDVQCDPVGTVFSVGARAGVGVIFVSEGVVSVARRGRPMAKLVAGQGLLLAGDATALRHKDLGGVLSHVIDDLDLLPYEEGIAARLVREVRDAADEAIAR